MRVLIANRGEIALRICRTVQRLGHQAIAVFHTEDRPAPFVEAADDAAELNGEAPAAAYLDIDQIVVLARRHKADAIHPGYGFLSENAEFARVVVDAGMCFIGPAPEVIETMGDKMRARELAHELGISALSTVRLEDHTIEYPLLIKAAAGGGGKGMRLVRSAGELEALREAATSEAARYFGDGRVYLERYIEQARHVEIQVFGDGQGGALHLGERDCSIQRNYQKIVEESPAFGLNDSIRDAMCDAAIQLVKATGYAGAGTVEFLLAPDGAFYFLEMNTRLQVEHPVTECVTGLDLVELQIEVARTGQLPISQDQVRFSGHALEVRVCAEDPDQRFRPSTGDLLRYVEPVGEGIRFDSGVKEGQAITASFDSMLAKLIVHGEDRDDCIGKASEALADLVMLGVATNVNYLQRLLALEAFAEAPPHTGFLSENADKLAVPELSQEVRDTVLIAALLGTRDAKRLHEAVTNIGRGTWPN